MATEPIHRRRMQDLIDSTGARLVEQATEDGVAVAELPGMRLRWYHIGQTRAAEPGTTGRDGEPASTETNVYVYDRIGGSMGVNAKTFASDLDAITSDVIHLRINSPGGSVFDAKAIMNSLRLHPAYVHAHIDAMAASAATIVMLGADEITVEPGGEVMVHRASAEHSGDDISGEAFNLWLRRQTEDLADLYSQRSGRPAAEWDELMTAETWFYGSEAVDYGLADRAERLARPVPAEDEEAGMAERMRRRHSLRGYKFDGRAAAGAPGRTQRTVKTAPAARTATRRSGVRSEVRDAGRLRQRAAGRGMMTRSAPAGITTMGRRSQPSGEIAYETVEHRGRQMFRTHGAFTTYGQGYDMWDMYGPYVEKVRAGAGAASINRPDVDCVFLLNHTGLTMARTAGPWNDHRGTLNLQEKSTTAWHEAFLNPARDDVRTMLSAIDDRLITEMSFAFLITSGVWNDDMTVYEIVSYDLHRGDVSAVNYGANPYTDISARASEILGELEQMPAGAISEAVRILGQRVGDYERLLREVDPGALARIAEPALTRGEGATDGDRGRADEWLSNAIGDADVPPSERHDDDEDDSDQPEETKVIDNTPDGGPTVAGYEALMRAHGMAIPQ